jgi:hypothetical protein
VGERIAVGEIKQRRRKMQNRNGENTSQCIKKGKRDNKARKGKLKNGNKYVKRN